MDGLLSQVSGLARVDWDATACLHRLTFQTIYQFLHWHLGQRTGQKGRQKRSTSKKSSLIMFWCCFRLVYERATNSKVDQILDRNLIHNVRT